MANHDDTYAELLKLVLREGKVKKNRTGIDTLGVFGAQAKFDLADGFPLLTTKKVFFKGIVQELLWFIKGDTNITYLVRNGVHIWDEWAYQRYKQLHIRALEEALITQAEFINLIATNDEFAKEWGDLGTGTYGSMWRRFPYYDDYCTVAESEGAEALATYDQLTKVITTLKSNPDDRRMIVSAWHPYWVDHCALPPCHVLFHFNTEDTGNGRVLNCLLYQRSCDLFLGIPFNIASYALLLKLVAHAVGMKAGVFTHTYGDLHLYANSLDAARVQLTRESKGSPTVEINPDVKSIFDVKYEDIVLKDYNCHPAIKVEVAV